MVGILLSRYSSFYYVLDENDNEWECKLRGIHRLNKIEVLPGDKVIFTEISKDKNGNKGVIEKILPRKNELYRPQVANVDQLLIVSAFVNPKPDLVLLDRLLILAEVNSLKPIIIFNKKDLTKEEEKIIAEYKNIGYEVIVSSAKTGEGIEQIRSKFIGKVSVLAGASGVGKSSILNSILPDIKLKTGEVSKKLKRGRHTTRHAQLLRTSDGGLVADTPGFSRLQLPKTLRKENLTFLFPEFVARLEQCKFSGCFHNKEPQCAIKDSVEKGEIAAWRYKHYLQFLEEVTANERSY